MCWLALSLCLGLVLAQWQPTPPPSPWLPALLSACCLGGLLLQMRHARAADRHARRRQGRADVLLLSFALLAGGYAWSAAAIQVRLADHLAGPLRGQPLTLDGWVSDLPQVSSSGVVHLVVDPLAAGRPAGVPARLALRMPGRPGAATVSGGQCLHLKVRLDELHGPLNFTGFDAEAWWWSSGVRATGTILTVAHCDDRGAPLLAKIQALRDRLRQRLRDVLGERPATGIVVALAVGDQGEVTPEQWKVLWRSGVGHLVSISGVHVTLLADLLRRLTERLWRCSASACRRFPAARAAAAIGFFAALFYGLVAGFGIPTRRTLCMLAVAWWADQRGIAPGGPRIFWLAVVLTLVSDPFACLSPGFWLSFGAVGGLILADRHGFGQPPAWRREFTGQWVSNLSLLPWIALWFGQVSLVAPLANLVAIPLVGMVITPLVLAALFPGLADCAQLAAWLLERLLEGLALLAGPDWAARDLAAPDPAICALAMLSILCLLMWPHTNRAQTLCLLLGLAPLCVPASLAPAEGSAHVEVVDVGQGLSVLVRTHTHLLVFDTGPRWPGGDAGTRTLLPLLRAEGLHRVDRLVLSHPDADHVGGAESLRAGLPVIEILSGFPRTGARPCQRGEMWTWDGIRFEFLHPPAEDPAASEGPAAATPASDTPASDGRAGDAAARRRTRPQSHARNNHACVLKVSSGSHTVLLPADIEAPVEAELTSNPELAAQLRSDVIVVAHHGSRTSSTAGFIAATGARWAIMSLGWHNRYRHPNPEVLQRWQVAGAAVLRTDQAGAVAVEMSANGVTVSCAHAARRAFWRSDGGSGACLAR